MQLNFQFTRRPSKRYSRRSHSADLEGQHRQQQQQQQHQDQRQQQTSVWDTSQQPREYHNGSLKRPASSAANPR